MTRSFRWVVLFFMFSTSQTVADSPLRFANVDVFIDSVEPLAAWQLEFSASAGVMQVVGVESGDSKAFDGAPYYDREAVAQGRADHIVVADFSLEDESELPSGRILVTTLHLMLSGDDVPGFDTRLIVATSYQGKRLDAEISIEISDGREQ